MQQNAPFFRSVLRCFLLVLTLLTIAARAQQVTLTPLATITVGSTPGLMTVNPATGYAYVLSTGANTVSAISIKTLTVSKVIPVGASPIAMAIDIGAGMVYVANSGDGTVSAIKGTAPALSWHVGGSPGQMVADTSLGQLYVADTLGDQVFVLNSKTGAILATISTGGLAPLAMAVNPATHAVFVANGGRSGSVVVIDGVHKKTLITITGLPVGATSISVGPQTNTAMVAFYASNALSVIDAANNYAVTTYLNYGGSGYFDTCPEFLSAPYLTAYDSASQYFYLSQGGYLFYGFVVADFGLVGWGPSLGCVVGGQLVPPEGAFAGYFNQFAIDAGAGMLASNGGPILNTAIEPGLTSAYEELAVASTKPIGVVFDPVKNWVYFSDAGNNTVTVYNVTPNDTVPAYEGELYYSVTENYADTNPATGTVYMLRVNNLYTINEAQAGAGYNGTAKNPAGVITIPLGGPASSEGLVVNAASNKIYVADGSNFFYSINGATNVATLLPGMPANLDVSSLAVDSATNQILVFDYFSGNLFVLDGTSETVVKTIPIGLFPRGTPLLVDPVKGVAYVVGYSVYVVDLATATITETIPLSPTAIAITAALNPGKSRLYVVTSNSEVYVINTSTNKIVTSFTSPYNPTNRVAVNPVTAKYYVIGDELGWPHVGVYSETTNKLIVDISGQTNTALPGADSITVNPLTNTIYVGTQRGTISAALAAIDGNTNALTAVLPSAEETNGYALAVDLGTNLLAAGGVDYTNLFFPTANLTAASSPTVSVTTAGVSDAFTIATTPLFRTTNTTPKVTITATGNVTGLAPAITPTSVFYQVDGWQGTWTEKALKAVKNTTSGNVTVTLSKLSLGRHILYALANTGESGTVQNGVSGPSSLVVSPTAAFVFTVEQ